MKTILVPTDFSKAAGNAAEYAVHLAKEIKARVILLHVYHLPVSVSEVPIMLSTAELQKENEIHLKKEAARLKKKEDVEVKCLVKMGLAVDEILEEEKNADLIVMGMRGAGKLSEVLIGSVTTTTLRKTNSPVLVIPEHVKYKTPERIVFACDYDSRTDIRTLNTLEDLMSTFGAKIYVVNIQQKEAEPVTEGKIKGIRQESKRKNVEYLYYFPEKENLVEGINEFVKDYHADMIAIIPHRYSLLERLFHKSVSKKMAFHTHVPLLALSDNHKTVPAYFI